MISGARLRLWARLLWVLPLLAGQQALAWNAAGHRLSAVIAWEQMSPAARRHADRLLTAHPDHPRWIQALARGRTHAPPDAPAPLALFAEASTWADDIRRDPRYTDDNRNGVGPDAARHRDRHYVNWPVDRGVGGGRGGRLDRELIRLIDVLRDGNLPEPQRTDALVWLLHLVGDAHQPLHVATWPLPDGSFDDGGLRLTLHDDAKPHFSESSLHSWWDDLPGPPWLRGKRLSERAAILARAFPASAIRQGDSQDWLIESLDLARRLVRPPEATEAAVWAVTPEYRAMASAVADRRIAEAGVRLGRLLDRLLADDGR